MNDMTTLGDALGAHSVDADDITELTEEYLLMVHGGNTSSTNPSIIEMARSAGDQLIRYVDQKFGPSILQVPLLIDVIVPPKPKA